MRVAERVQLALRAVLAGRHLERLDVESTRRCRRGPSAGSSGCSPPRAAPAGTRARVRAPARPAASARFSLVTKLGFTGTLCGSWSPSRDRRRPRPGRRRSGAVMSATSGSGRDDAQRGARPAGAASEQAADASALDELASREAMAVTPDEGGPLDREALCRLRPSRPIWSNWKRRRWNSDGCQVAKAEMVRCALRAGPNGALGVVAAHAERVAAPEEALDVGVAAVAVEALAAEDRLARSRRCRARRRRTARCSSSHSRARR